jgi:hypothetical protein
MLLGQHKVCEPKIAPKNRSRNKQQTPKTPLVEQSKYAGGYGVEQIQIKSLS